MIYHVLFYRRYCYVIISFGFHQSLIQRILSSFRGMMNLSKVHLLVLCGSLTSLSTKCFNSFLNYSIRIFGNAYGRIMWYSLIQSSLSWNIILIFSQCLIKHVVYSLSKSCWSPTTCWDDLSDLSQVSYLSYHKMMCLFCAIATQLKSSLTTLLYQVPDVPWYVIFGILYAFG